MVREAYQETIAQIDNQERVEESSRGKQQKQRIAITATFTAELVEESLAFWMQELDISSQVEFAPYNQVFQQLLAPSSLLAKNENGINVVLVRLEDWQRFENNSGEEDAVAEADSWHSSNEKIERNVQDLILALKSAAERSTTPHLLCLCSASPAAVADVNRKVFFQQIEERIVSQLSSVSGVHLLTTTELATTYPVSSYYDPKGDKLGHIPFTPLFFTALGTAIARKIYAIKSAPHKVIVLDCDQTLWKGVCGEDGAMGIEIAPAWKALQEFIVAQHEAGMLICLCSKNVEEDVLEVFERRLEMPLKREYLVSWRINWQPKSENLKSLAKELNLGLDSFIFIDDNPVECSEVQANCPEVLTLQLPQDTDSIPRFLNHIWAFDRIKVTEADKKRTDLYKQNIERERVRKQALNFDQFLAALELKIQISELEPHQLARVSQLTQRTNQFNATTIRRSEAEIQKLCHSENFECLVVEVSDRFGDYGLVGAIVFKASSEAINVDTFLLSCRVLGRGVEHRMLARLGEIAAERGLKRVDFQYIPTKKNQPIFNFINGIGADFKQSQSEGYCFKFPVEFAASLTYSPAAAEQASTEDLPVEKSVSSGTNLLPTVATTEGKSARLSRSAIDLYEVELILRAIEAQALHHRPENQQTFVAPRTVIEEQIAKIWTQVLRLEKVGIQDNYFDLGGTSLLAVGIFTQIEEIFRRNLPITTLLQAPTVEQLARTIDQEEESTAWSSLVPIQLNGAKKPLFVVHGGLGDALGFVELARHLGSDQPFYGLRGVGLDGIQAPLTTVEETAVRYVAEIRTVQPEGPYLLAGQCSGGTVAFEMAQQLKAQGQEIALLALLDTAHPQLNNYFTERFRHYKQKPRFRHDSRDYSFYISHLTYPLRKLSDVLPYHLRQLAKGNPAQQLAYIHYYIRKGIGFAINKIASKFVRRVKIYKTQMVPESQAFSENQAPAKRQTLVQNSAERQAFIKDRFFETSLRALQAYVPQPYSGKIDFFLATLNSYVPIAYPSQLKSFLINGKTVKDSPKLLFGWDEVATGGFEIHEFESRHDRMLGKPQVRVLAEKLTACLDSVNRGKVN